MGVLFSYNYSLVCTVCLVILTVAQGNAIDFRIPGWRSAVGGGPARRVLGGTSTKQTSSSALSAA